MIERINRPLEQNRGKRFYILHGIGIEDLFFASSNSNHFELTIENVILEELKNQGYQRVIFSSPHRSVYFLDIDSEELSWPIKNGIRSNDHPDHQMQRLDGGPLATMMLFKPTTNVNTRTPLESMGDIATIRFLDTIIKETTIRSAVVFLQAETSLNSFEAPRILSGLISEWARLPYNNRNSCFLLFAAGNLDQLINIANGLAAPELRYFILDKDHEGGNHATIQIGSPEHEEITHLIEYVKQTTAIQVNPNETDKISHWMAAEGISARQWLERFSLIPNLDLLTFRKQGWIKAFQDKDINAEERLNSLIGLHEIKNRIRELTSWLLVTSERKNNPKAHHPTLHMIFTGNPGTGKTTVARIIGEILHDIGLLRKGHLVEAKGSDLVAEHVGGTALKTDNLVNQAIEGVLFIDEAYVLTETERGGFGQEAVDTLLSHLENDREKLVVILAGYPDKMRRFIHSNPGLTRRFPEDNIFHFPDYTTQELWDILEQVLRNMGLAYTPETDIALKKVIDRLHITRDEFFGNAGEMRNLAESLDRRRAFRIHQNGEPFDIPLNVEDIPDKYRGLLTQALPSPDTLLSELNGLVGLKSVKDIIRNLVERVQYENLRSKVDPDYNPSPGLQHMVFEGNPGTGKTTVARLLGKIYHSLGLLKKGHLVEVARSDLVAGYIGQSALKSKEKIRDALDGVLFIDEAYSLNQGYGSDFEHEAIDTLVKTMDDYRNRLVVITAGYPEQMTELIASNPGLSSRFGLKVHFPDFNILELGEILMNFAQREKYLLPPEVLEGACRYLEYLRQVEDNFGNARSVRNLFEEMKGALAARIMNTIMLEGKSTPDPDELVRFSLDDIPILAFQRIPANVLS